MFVDEDDDDDDADEDEGCSFTSSLSGTLSDEAVGFCTVLKFKI